MNKYIRSERANLFEPNVYIGMVVKLSGDLLREEIEEAVYKAYEANEATMSKIVLEENGGRVHKAIYKKLKNKNMKYFILLFMERLCPSLTDAVLLQSHECYQNKLSEKMAKVMGYTGDGGRDLRVTNLNKIDIPSVHERISIKDIMIVPPKVSYAKNVVGISTYEEGVTVCYHKMKKD